MIQVTEAIAITHERAHRLESERVTLDAARGRVLAQDVLADTDLPPFDRSQMDGYALRAEDTKDASAESPARLRVVGESAAGRGWHGTLNAGEAARIMTGAPVPAGADAVQKVEVTRAFDDDRAVEILEPAKVGQSILPRASEVERGAIALHAGTRITSSAMAILASFGCAQVRVSKRPRVAILATGTELVPVDETPAADQIRDSNSYALAAYAETIGAQVERLPLAGDDEEKLKQTIADAAKRADVLILSGGVSVGDYDFTKPALRALGAEIFFERVALRPGKPTVFAGLEDTETKHRTLVFGLPGNPVSVAVTFQLFARTAILAMQGATETGLIEETATLAREAKGTKERTVYLPARLRTDKDARLVAEPLQWRGSSDFVAFAAADSLIIIPAGARTIEAGELVRAVRLPND